MYQNIQDDIVVKPTSVALGLLRQLARFGSCAITGGSLLRADSKDVDIWLSCSTIKIVEEYLQVRVGAELLHTTTEYKTNSDNQDFHWDGLIKCKLHGITFDILFKPGYTIQEVMRNYPLTIQQVSWQHNKPVFGEDFELDCLRFSPTCRCTIKDKEAVLMKYIGYYPGINISYDTFIETFNYIGNSMIPPF